MCAVFHKVIYAIFNLMGPDTFSLVMLECVLRAVTLDR